MPPDVTQKRTAKLAPKSGSAQIRANTFDAKARTVQVVATTGQRVLRGGWDGVYDGPYWEELSLDPSAVRLERLNSGRANVIDNHGYSDGDRWGPSRYATDVILGVITKDSVRLKPGEMSLEVRFSERDEIAGKIKDVETGIIAQLSLGYRVWKYAMVENAADGYPVMRAIDWEPLELSPTAVAAETGAFIRSSENANPCTVEDLRATTPNGKTSMDPELVNAPTATLPKPAEPARGAAPAQNAQPAPAVPTPTPAPAPSAEVERAVQADRARGEQIVAIGTKAGVERVHLDDMVKRGLSIDQARAEILERWVGKDAAPASAPSMRASVSEPGRDKEVESMRDALLHRGLPGLFPAAKLSEQARSFVSFTLLDLARHCLERRGERVRGGDKMEIVTRAFHSTSDFPELLANTANKSLRDQYDVLPNTWKAWAKSASLNDFKITSRAQISGAPALELVPESGAVQKGPITEGAEKYGLKTYGKIVAITRQAIINDDLGAFTRIPSQFAVSASVLVEDLAYAILTVNAALADAVALFHATHNNLATGGGSALAVAGLSGARVKLRNQTGLDGKYLNLSGAILLVPVALETTAQQLIAPIQAAAATSVNPFAGSLRIVVNPRLDVVSLTRWFLICETSRCDTVEVGFLDGQEGPRLETEAGFDVEGIKIKCMLDVNAKAIDFRGMVQNDGV